MKHFIFKIPVNLKKRTYKIIYDMIKDKSIKNIHIDSKNFSEICYNLPYIFISAENTEDLFQIKGIHGLSPVHGSWKDIVPFSYEEISQMFLKDSFEEKKTLFQVGNSVLIQNGMFKNTSGIIIGIENNTYILEVKLLGKLIKIKLEEKDIK